MTASMPVRFCYRILMHPTLLMDLTGRFGWGSSHRPHSLSATLHRYSPRTFRSSSSSTMGIQREPGQKGVNWSNIAVGEHIFASCPVKKMGTF
jgi:hypothetical protein